MRKRWKWFAMVAGVIAAAIWLYWFNIRLATTLRLGQTQNGLETGKVSFDVRSNRLIKLLNPCYSIEAHTPAGSTNYKASFSGQGAFQSAGATVLIKGSVPVGVAVPIDVDDFRVTLDLAEHSAFYSGLVAWLFNRPDDGNLLNRRIRQWLLQAHRKGMPRTIRSPWLVRSNNVWVEKVEG